ncbi:protein of unknown function [Candidatus Hydrogenisulfobacillus filiaventi]|uniref:Uncharacterized protein n=1 Tax=Candidatus Hydrogenisulfobacillus filiaventi TaxID=2707344 RepID=A0A6F8ZGW7_9FIRM|nr:protein of unknown function [Candidatus Hydrogenisulfobacillus filiaventi]
MDGTRFLARFRPPGTHPARSGWGFWEEALATETWLAGLGVRVRRRVLSVRGRTWAGLRPWLDRLGGSLMVEAHLEPEAPTGLWDYLQVFLEPGALVHVRVALDGETAVDWRPGLLGIRARAGSWPDHLAGRLEEGAARQAEAGLAWWWGGQPQAAWRLPAATLTRRRLGPVLRELQLAGDAGAEAPVAGQARELLSALGRRTWAVTLRRRDSLAGPEPAELGGRPVWLEVRRADGPDPDPLPPAWPEPWGLQAGVQWTTDWSPEWEVVLTLRRFRSGSRVECLYRLRPGADRAAAYRTLARDRRRLPILALTAAGDFGPAPDGRGLWQRAMGQATAAATVDALRRRLAAVAGDPPPLAGHARLCRRWRLVRPASRGDGLVLESPGLRPWIVLHPAHGPHPGGITLTWPEGLHAGLGEIAPGLPLVRTEGDWRYWLAVADGWLLPALAVAEAEAAAAVRGSVVLPHPPRG